MTTLNDLRTTVQSLWIHPVKSFRGIQVTEAEVTEIGLAYDREWMLVDSEGQFLTQRQIPELAGMIPSLADGFLNIHRDGELITRTELVDTEAETLPVRIWKSDVEAKLAPGEVNQALSEALGRAVRLVRHGAQTQRRAVARGRDFGGYNKFSDALPVLLTNRASLRDLNARLSHPVEMRNFRPNIEVDLPQAYQEDRLASIRGPQGLSLNFAMGCSRCIVITRDPESGADRGPEPLTTLSAERRGEDGGVYFGVLMTVAQGGRLRVGDELECLFGAH